MQEATRTRRVEDRDISIRPMYRMVVERPQASLKVGETPAEAAKAIISGPLVAEVTWPTVCRVEQQPGDIYAQTRRVVRWPAHWWWRHHRAGTIELTSGPSGASAGSGDVLPAG